MNADATSTRLTRCVLALRALLTLAGAAAALAAPTQAQEQVVGLPAPGDGFAWERVGDTFIQPFALAFGPDGTLWAAADDGPYRLDLSGGFHGTWVLTSDYPFAKRLLPLGRSGPLADTLVVGTNGSVQRSLDGGRTFDEVYDGGGEYALYEVPQGLPFAGRVLAGDLVGIGYSTDRAASFADAAVPAPGGPGNAAGAADFLALPLASAHAGRVLAAGRWGVNVSDDGGETFRESALWGVLVYVGEALGVAERADTDGGGLRAVMVGRLVGQSGRRVWVSDDDGETWGPEGGAALPEGPPVGPGGDGLGVFGLGGPSALAVLGRGTVYRTGDGGATWAAVGRAPEVSEDIYANAAAMGQDGRLYVGLLQTGANGEGWVWRTQEVLATAAEVGSPEGEDSGLEVRPNPARGRITITYALPSPSHVRLALYDALGREVAVLLDGAAEAGTRVVAFDARALPAGVYVVRLEAEGRIAARRVTVLR